MYLDFFRSFFCDNVKILAGKFMNLNEILRVS
jgi:hypothetical protein